MDKTFLDLTKITTPNGSNVLAIHDGNGLKGITLDDLLIPRRDDLLIPRSVEQANCMPRITPKTMTHTELISHLSEVAKEDFTNVRLGDIVTFGNQKVYIAEFNRNYTHNGRGVATIDFVDVTHHDGYGYGTLMNDTSTTGGGFVGSKAYKTHLPAINTELATYFGSYLFETQELLTNAVSNGLPSGWSWYGMKARIMSAPEALGITYCGQRNGDFNLNPGNEHQQLALFKCKPELICTKENYWLRDVTSASGFAYVRGDGGASSAGAGNSDVALRVCFSIKCTD